MRYVFVLCCCCSFVVVVVVVVVVVGIVVFGCIVDAVVVARDLLELLESASTRGV